MFIDKRRGRIFLGDVTIRRSLTWTQTIRSASAADPLPVGTAAPQFSSFSFPTTRVDPETEAYGVLHFEGERLRAVQIILSGKDSPLIVEKGQVSLEKEKKLFHDDFLERELGPPPYEYSWGVVGSGYDDKSVSSSIWVHYRPRAYVLRR